MRLPKKHIPILGDDAVIVHLCKEVTICGFPEPIGGCIKSYVLFGVVQVMEAPVAAEGLYDVQSLGVVTVVPDPDTHPFT
jgi:hypothetical protein